MRHHYGAPGANLGVTTSFWDTLFGTEAAPRVVADGRADDAVAA